MRRTEVTFRGEDREVVIDSVGSADPETNSPMDVEWHFDGLTPEQHDALNITDVEDDAIYQQLCDVICEYDE